MVSAFCRGNGKILACDGRKTSIVIVVLAVHAYVVIISVKITSLRKSTSSVDVLRHLA